MSSFLIGDAVVITLVVIVMRYIFGIGNYECTIFVLGSMLCAFGADTQMQINHLKEQIAELKKQIPSS